MVNQEMNEGINTESGGILLGEYLKQGRVDKNFTLEKLSQKTKISVNILKNLEANDYDHLPSAAYIKGFVMSYVKVLGLPKDEAINKMEYTYLNILGKPFPALNHTKLMKPAAEIPAQFRPSKAEDVSPHEVIEKGENIIDSTKSMLPVIIFGVVILLFVGGYKLVSSVVESEVSNKKTKDLGPKIESSSALINHPEKKPTPETATPPSTTAADTSAAVTTPVAGPQTPPAVTAAPVEEKPEPPAPQIQRNFPSIEFKKIRGRLFSVRTDAAENSDTTLLPERIKSSMTPDMQNVYVHAVDGSTWLSYKMDEKPIVSVILNKGEDLLLQGNQIRLFLGNVNVTKIFYNNYMIEAPTKNGVKSLVFPEESNDKFLMPLFPKAKDDILYTAEDYMKRMKLEEEELEKKAE